jgi:hypothetical protein
MFMDHYATSQSATQFRPLYLPIAIGKADRVITAPPRALDAVRKPDSILAFEWSKSTVTFRCFDPVALVELTEVVLSLELISSGDRR